MQKRVDPIKRALELRKTLIRGNEVLVANFTDTLQGKDTSKVIDLMPNIINNEYIFRTKVNVKQIDPIAAGEYGLDFFDIREKTPEQIEAFIRQHEFDFPLWFKHNFDFSMKRAADYNLPFIMQVAGCNFHDGTEAGGCWYCFVDDKSNDGIPGAGKTFLSVEDVPISMLVARSRISEKYRKLGHDLEIKVLRTSGGEPTIALDWVLNLWREIGKRGLNFVGQIDSNLSTGTVVDHFEQQGIYEPNILEKLAEHPVKVLTALKGTDEESLQNNVQSTATMATQLYSIKKFLFAGFDIYPQMYNPNPATLREYLEKTEKEIPNFPLRIHIGPLKIYSPTRVRLAFRAKKQGINPEEFVAEKQAEWDSNYKNSCQVLDDYLRKTHKVGYKEITRSDVDLTVKD